MNGLAFVPLIQQKSNIILSKNTRLYYNINSNSTDGVYDPDPNCVGSDGERYFDDEKKELEVERERLLAMFFPVGEKDKNKKKEKTKSPSASSAPFFASLKEEPKESKKMTTKNNISKGRDTPSSAKSRNTKSRESHSKLNPMERKYLEVEMKLLASLKTSDAAMGELYNFWYNYRGYDKMTRLYQAGEMCQHPNQWKEAEKIIRNLILEETTLSLSPQLEETCNSNDIVSSSSSKNDDEIVNNTVCDCDDFGDYDYYSECYRWVEPINRLATLLFYQGQLEESKKLCEFVLKHKPWHFGCQTGIVTVCQQLNDTAGVEYWSAKRMPPLQEEEQKMTKDKSDDVTNRAGKITPSISPRETYINDMLQLAQTMLEEEDDIQNEADGNGCSSLLPSEDDNNDNHDPNVWE